MRMDGDPAGFVIQAVAYEYRRKPGNVFGEKTFNAF